jgi:hypothetical protein
MKNNLSRTLCLILFALYLSSANLIVAQAQASTLTASDTRRTDVGHRVQVQLLVASNIATVKTDYPISLESVVKQLKSSLSFKNHHLVATYIYNVADGSALDVSDVTYAQFEPGGGLAPTFFNLGISGIKLNVDSDSTHISRFRFETRKRIFIGNVQGEGDVSKPVSDMVGTGITTELNVSEGIPTIVGTTTSGLSEGVLVLVITVNRTGAR